MKRLQRKVIYEVIAALDKGRSDEEGPILSHFHSEDFEEMKRRELIVDLGHGVTHRAERWRVTDKGRKEAALYLLEHPTPAMQAIKMKGAIK